MLYTILSLFITAIVAFLSVRWIYFKILHIAKVKNLTDNPDARKLQKEPVPIMGGIAVFFGLTVGLLASGVLDALPSILEHSALIMPNVSIFPILATMVLMLYVGALDDIVGLSPRSRLFIEIASVLCIIIASGNCIDNFHGLWGIYQISWWIAVPLTVFAGVGIINAVNMIDGVNGLSSGLCIVYCLIFGFTFFKVGDIQNAALAVAVVGALIPFYAHNVFGLKSRMFIGDAGTMVMGILMLWFVINMLCTNSPVVNSPYATSVDMIALSLAILSVPVFDTLRVMTMRMIRKKNPFHPDKTHLHHVFIKIGVSHAITSLTMILLDFLVVVIWTISYKAGANLDVQLYVTVFAAAVLVWGTYGILSYHAIHHTDFLHTLTAFSIRTHLGRTQWWKRLTELLDSPEEEYQDYLEFKRLGEANDNNVSDKSVEKARQNRKKTFDDEPLDPEDLKEADRRKIIDFMKGRSEVYVDDIRQNSGANALRIYPILFEEEQKGRIKVIRRRGLGAPEIVALVE